MLILAVQAPYWSAPRHTMPPNVDPSESNITASTPSPRAAQTYVRGNPEPDSYQRYEFVAPPEHAEHGHGGPLPSSYVDQKPNSATGTNAHPNVHAQAQNLSGVGSSGQLKHPASKDPAEHTNLADKSTTHVPEAAKDHEPRLPPDFNVDVRVDAARITLTAQARGGWQPPKDPKKHEVPPSSTYDKPSSHPHPAGTAKSQETGPEKVGI